MPLYEYACTGCGREFEALVRSPSDTPSCPTCGTVELARRMSVPAAPHSGTTRSELPVCASGAPSGGCGAPACGGGFCAMGN